MKEHTAPLLHASAEALQIRAIAERSISERPAEIREAARLLSRAIADQIAALNASKPNEPERLAQQDEFVAFLQTIADGLDNLAVSIDRAIAAGSGEKPEPFLLAQAGEVARQLSVAIGEGLQRNSAYIVDCTIKFTVFGAGFCFLRLLGVDGWIAGTVGALMNLKIPTSAGKDKS